MKNKFMNWHNLFKFLIYIFLYFALILLIVLPWFFHRGGLFFTDMVWGPQSALFGIKLGAYYDIFEKLYISFVFAVILFGGWRVVKSLVEDKAIIFLASAFALFNPFVYDRVMYGQLGIVLAYGLFLASFGYLLEARNNAEGSAGSPQGGSTHSTSLGQATSPQVYAKQRGISLLLSALFAGLAISQALHFVFFVGLTYLIFFILLLLKQRNKNERLKTLGFFILAGVIILVLNSGMVKTFFLQDSQFSEFVTTAITQKDLELFKTRGDNFFEIIKNIASMTGFWGSEQFRYASPQGKGGIFGLSFYLLLFPILILGLVTGFKSKEERRLRWGLLFIYFAAFILTIGIALPLARQITLWMFDNVSFYSGLREPQKWIAVIIAVYEVLLVLGLKKILQEKAVLEYKKIAVFIFAIFIIAQAQLLVWGALGQAKPVSYPKDWYEVNEFTKSESYQVGSHECDGKILFLPWHLYMSFNWVGNIINTPARVFFDCPVISGTNMEAGEIYDNSLSKEGKEISAWIFVKGESELLKDEGLGIKYIILAQEVDWLNYNWLDERPEIELIKETETLKVYKVIKF